MEESLASKLVRNNIKQLTPYKSARGTAMVSDDLIFMDAAENPWSPFEDSELNRYPSPQPQELLTALGDLYNTNPSNILMSRGSEESIRLVIQTFCTPNKDKILTCPPTFAMYKSEAATHDIENIVINRIGEFSDNLDIETIKEKIDNIADIKIIFICNPGNPSSTTIPTNSIETILEYTKDKCLVVIDEAYIEFANHQSFVNQLNKYPNLIIFRTLSKSYGLAGLRIGCTIASEGIISYIRRAMLAYPLPRPTIEIALKTLTTSALSYMQQKQITLKQERAYVSEQLKGFSCIKKIYPSETNFLCLIVEDVKDFVEYFKKHGIIIRDRSIAIENAVNIAIGTREQNEKVINIIKDYKL